MNTCTLFAWWGFNLWLPSYLKSSAAQGGAGLSGAATTGYLFIMQAGMWFGYVTFGFVSDRFGRKRTYVTYLLSRGGAARGLRLGPESDARCWCSDPFVAFAATGYFSGFGAVTAEIYPTSIRATAQGFTYNIGRLASAAAPFLVGTLADTHGFGPALLVCSAAFVARRGLLDLDSRNERKSPDMKRTHRSVLFVAAFALMATPAAAQNRAEDEYTRYELLAPETVELQDHLRPGGGHAGSEGVLQRDPQHHSGERPVGDRPDDGRGAQDQRSDRAARRAARASKKQSSRLATCRWSSRGRCRPAAKSRIRIHKTYKDAPTYHREGDAVVFNRALTVKRDIVVLPANYEILGGERSSPGDRTGGRPDRREPDEHLSRRRAARAEGPRRHRAAGSRARRPPPTPAPTAAGRRRRRASRR